MNRNSIIQHIELQKSRLGTYAAVARKSGVNQGALSAIIHGKYQADSDAMLQRIAQRLGYREPNWQIVPTIANYTKIAAVAADARHEAMWFAISNKAGSGKTKTLEDIYNTDTTGGVTFIQCEEWHGRQFLIKLIQKTLGYKALEGKYKNIAQLMDMVVGYFAAQTAETPLLLIDEADKLRPAALRTLIPLYNRTEERLGVLLSGTENLKKEMRLGVRHHKKGYDELESRIGRTYIDLPGARKEEVAAICAANGITDTPLQDAIWNELKKTQKPTTVRTTKGVKEVMMYYVEDFRRVNRIIKRELLKNKATYQNP